MKYKWKIISIMAVFACTLAFGITIGGPSVKGFAAQKKSSSTKKMKIMIVHKNMMGSQWTDLFDEGAKEGREVNKDFFKMKSRTADDSQGVEKLVKKAISKKYDGILLSFAPEGDKEEAAVSKAITKGIAVVTLADNMENGYTLEAPDNLGKAMTQSLIARIALRKGQKGWTDESDFSSQLHKAVRGSWITGNSSQDRKQFSGPYIMEFNTTDPSMGYFELNRVSLLAGIADTPDGDGYDFRLNTGNHYYLYPASPGTLECHWEPDGYSASDSLFKGYEISGDSPDNSNSFFNLDSYTGTEETFKGRISSFQGYNSSGAAENCLALNLNTPVRVTNSNGLDTLIYAMQLNAGSSIEKYVGQGTNISIKGSLFEAHTDHHFTPVLLNVSQVNN